MVALESVQIAGSPRCLLCRNESLGNLVRDASSEGEQACQHAELGAPRADQHLAIYTAKEGTFLWSDRSVDGRERSMEEPAPGIHSFDLLLLLDVREPCVPLFSRESRERLVNT